MKQDEKVPNKGHQPRCSWRDRPYQIQDPYRFGYAQPQASIQHGGGTVKVRPTQNQKTGGTLE